MFQDNKREIFGFRKYKAYGLASAVIAAFFLMGGVASADEVTSSTSSNATALTTTSPKETSADTATVASSEEASVNNSTVASGETVSANSSTVATSEAVSANSSVAENTVANTATETPAVASGNTTSATDAFTTSPYVSEQAKQSVSDNLMPLVNAEGSAPTVAQVYKEAPDAVSKLTSDDRVVIEENKKAFDKLPDVVRRRVKSVTIDKQDNGNLGHTASISGNVVMNAQYFHNDGVDGETEVLYHEVGHAVDGATYKRNADGSEYSLSRDTAVQPLIQKAYPGQANYEGWASMFGTYMLQTTGQREIKTELDREINTYFTSLLGSWLTRESHEFVNTNTGGLNVTVSTKSTDRTVTSTNANDGVKRLNELAPHVLDVTVSGTGSLTDNSYIDVTVETNLPVNDINKNEILTNTFKGTSYVPVSGDYKKSTQTARISLAGLTDGTQKGYVIQANEFHKDAPVMSHLKRIVTYKVYIDGTLQATKVFTDTLIPANPLLDGKTSETQYVRIHGESGVQDRYRLTSDDSTIRVNSKRPYGVYEVTVPEDVKMTLGQDESLESYRSGNKYVLPQDVIDAKKIRFDTSVAAKKALDADSSRTRLDQTVNVSYYYSDEKFEDVSSAKKIDMSRPLVTLLSDTIPGDGNLALDMSIEKPRVFVLSTSSENTVTGKLTNGTTSSPEKSVAVRDTLLTLNTDDKPLNDDRKFILQPMRTGQDSTVSREFRDSTMKVSVVDADTGVKIGVAEAYKALDIPKTTKRLKLHVETDEKLGYLSDASISELNYSVTFKSNMKDAMSWKKDMDDQNVSLTETRFKFDLLDDQGSTIVNKETKLSIFNDRAVVNIGDSTYAVFTPTTVQKDLFLPILTSKSLRDDVFPLAALEYVKVDDSNNILKSRVFYNGPIEDESRRPATGSYVDTVYDGSPGVYNGIWFKSELPAGTNVYEIPVRLKMKDPIRTLNDKGGLVNEESVGYLRVLTYDAKSRLTFSTISYKSQRGKKAVIDDQTKEITLSSYVYNMTDGSVNDLSAMAYIPRAGVEGSIVDAKLVRKIDAPSGWKVLYTTNDISGDYSKDRNLAFSESVDDYTKVTALKFVAEQPVASQSGKRFDVPVLTKMTQKTDAMYYRTALLTGDKEVLSAPVVATPEPKSVEPKPEPKPTPKPEPKPIVTKLTIKHVLDPNDEMTNKFRNMQSSELGDLQNYDLQQTGELERPVVRTINAGVSTSISKLASKSIYEPYDISTFGDGLKFDYTRVTAEMTDDLKDQLNSGNINVDTDTSIQGTGVSGSEATITYYYKVRTGKLVERFVDKNGVEIAPAKESAESIAYGEFVPTGHPDSIQSGNSTYNYESTDAPSVYRSRLDYRYSKPQFGVVEGTTTVTYVYDKVVTNGSVIATYKDTEGNELAPQENVKTDVPDGEAYTTTAKTIPSSEIVEKTPEGLTKRTTTSYELIETPANAEGNVVGNQTITVPYVYRKNVDVQIYGSVIATYKDEDGNELASMEKVITNQPGGTYYAAADKPIQGSAQSKVTPEGRIVTVTTYELIKTPDNETGDVVGGEIIEVPYVYRKKVVERLVPGNTPSVEIPELKVTRYQTEDGTDIKDSSEGFVDAPNTIDKYQFTGTTNMNEGNDVQTHIYKLIETEIPGDAPKVDIPVLNVTRYVNEEGTEIKDSEEGLIPAPSMIGENYQFTGRTETTEDGSVQTHIYKVVEHEVPGDAPKRIPEELQITLHVDEETGKELVDYDPGLTSPKEIEHYTYTGKTTQEEGIRTHYYNKVITEIPGDAPSVEIPELKVTRYQTEDGADIQDSSEGFVDAPKTIGDYQFTGVTNMNEGNDVQTHIYSKIVTEVPGDAPQVDIPELTITRHVDQKGKELLPIEEGSNGPRKTIGDYEYTGRTDVEGGVTTHVYAPIRYELPGDAPQYDIPELKVTRHVDEKGKELIETEKGTQPPRKTIGENEYTGRTTEKDGITTHVYTSIKHEIPGDAPQYDIPELKVTRHVDEKGKELIETEKGNQPPRKTIGDNEYTGRTTEKDGITTHVYTPIKHEVPGDAPIVDVPELKVTRYVNEKGEEIKESEAGFINAPKTIGEYEFTGKTELNEGKDVQTHIYKLVEKPVTPTPDPKKPETPSPRTPDTKTPETPKTEVPKSNDSKPVVTESVDQPQFVKNELPKTGETTSNLALVGVSLLTALGLIGFIKRKRED